MIGSLAASPAGDGVDFGGHFWIPEGAASNIEELELLWPMLFLYRRALHAGAGGAGRFRGGRGMVEAGIPWTVPGMAAAVYTDESFPKAVGPFGGNPGSAGHFRLKHGTDVAGRFGAGEVPQDFDAIAGAEAKVEAKGPMLMMAADAAWEWTGANAPGFGDPLTRAPGPVRVDIASGALPADMAERVYGVVPGEDATRALRAERLAARLAGAAAPAVAPATVPEDVPLRPLAGELAVVERDGRPEAFVSLTGRAVLAPAGGNFKDGCAVLERPLRDVAPEFASREGRAGQRTRYREYLCPVTGLRVDSEIVKEGDEALHDIEIAVVQAVHDIEIAVAR
jgi:N-methylhydantoinase B